MYSIFFQQELKDIQVDFEKNKSTTFVGKISPEQRENSEHMLNVVQSEFVKAVGSEERVLRFYDRLRHYAEREDRLSMSTLYFVRERV